LQNENIVQNVAIRSEYTQNSVYDAEISRIDNRSSSII